MTSLSRANGISFILRIGMMGLFLLALFERSYVVAVGILLSIFLAFLPSVLRKNVKIHLPWMLDFSVSFALFLHTAGITFDLYHNPEWWWWDELTHFLGSFVVGMIAFHLVFTMNFLGKVTMSVPMMGLFLFLTAMGIGGIWEIGEYYSDRFLGTNTQLSLEETIRDLQFDLLGAMVISLVAMRYFYVLRSRSAEKWDSENIL